MPDPAEFPPETWAAAAVRARQEAQAHLAACPDHATRCVLDDPGRPDDTADLARRQQEILARLGASGERGAERIRQPAEQRAEGGEW